MRILMGLVLRQNSVHVLAGLGSIATAVVVSWVIGTAAMAICGQFGLNAGFLIEGLLGGGVEHYGALTPWLVGIVCVAAASLAWGMMWLGIDAVAAVGQYSIAVCRRVKRV